ncbi:MAG TPA: translation initiation factor IF-2 [Nitrososphaera sp.]|nr:translation initiation factor IF-2 [Nitrososphaera sp.]
MTSEKTMAEVVEIPSTLTVRELADRLHVSPVEIIKELMKRGVMAAINQSIEYEVAASVANSLGFQTQQKSVPAAALATQAAVVEEDPRLLQLRPPVVTVMGHVDHGKTSLLDAVRETNVTQQETGGITQHIGAYQVEIDGHRITFIDTPGHEAFTTMRARGSKVTDIAVLVVAADDGVMPQTIEAIDHAKAAGVPIIVAINKIDLPDANPDRIKQQLTEHGLLIEEWGGDTIAVEVSAKTKQGLKDLLDNILVVAEVSELKSNPNRSAVGTVLEAEMDSSRGPMASVLIQNGTLHVGDIVVAGETFGKVKAMFNELGHRVKEAGPSTPVKVMGLDAVPKAGDVLRAAKDEKSARELTESSQQDKVGKRLGGALSLEAMSGEIAAGRTKDLNIIIKADVQGSIEAIRTALERLSTDEIRINIVHAGTGNISESDIMLAIASNSIAIAFRVKVDPVARRQGEADGVDIRQYEIIYDLINDIEKAVKGLLEPVIMEVVEGHAEVRAVFRVKGGRIAGCMVKDGTIRRNAPARVIRAQEIIHASRVSSLKRFQEDVREVQTGYECGVGIEGFDQFQEGDVIEAYTSRPAPG